MLVKDQRLNKYRDILCLWIGNLSIEMMSVFFKVRQVNSISVRLRFFVDVGKLSICLYGKAKN
jgi:hypothetical protein